MAALFLCMQLSEEQSIDLKKAMSSVHQLTEELEASRRHGASLQQRVQESSGSSADLISALTREAEALKAKLADDAEAIRELQSRASRADHDRAVGVQELVVAMDAKERLQAELGAARSQVANLSGRVDELQRSALSAQQAAAAAQSEREALLVQVKQLKEAASSRGPATPTDMASPASRKNKKVVALPFSSPDSLDVKSTPSTSSRGGSGGRNRIDIAGTPTEDQAEVIKNYMRNQLDLQESEWESYEETINNLMEQLLSAQRTAEVQEEALGKVTAERDELQSRLASLQSARPSAAAAPTPEAATAPPSSERAGRPPALVVEFSSDHRFPNQPSSVRSHVSQGSNPSSSPSQAFLRKFDFDFSGDGLETIQEQVEQYQTHMEQQVRQKCSFSLLSLLFSAMYSLIFSCCRGAELVYLA
jgi:hypothetical protein